MSNERRIARARRFRVAATRPFPLAAVAGALVAAGCGSGAAIPPPPALAPEAAACSLDAARPWIESWFGAWELTSVRILRLPDAPAPEVLFFDATCAYTTSEAAARGAAVVEGPTLRGARLPWRTYAHGGTLTLPDGSASPVQLASFTSATPGRGPYFVMSAPSYWESTGRTSESLFTGVFLHEFAHTRQVEGMKDRLGPIDASWQGAQELDDDAVQRRFESDPEYVAAYTEERDLLYASADAPSIGEARELAARALAKMRARHARWLTGDDAVYATLDGMFLLMEAVGQWSAYAWLAHPEGGGLDRAAAISTMLGRRRWWAQDEGLALLLAIDRLFPEWPTLAFAVPSPGALELLERAVAAPATD